MRETAKALKTFASGFGLPAYSNSSVPDEVALPYIVYPMTEPEWDQKASFYMVIWDKTTNYTGLLTVADNILRSVGRGVKIDLADGYLVIWPESPAVQEMNDKENDLKGIYLNFSINAYHLPGV